MLALVLGLPVAAFGQATRLVIHADQGRDTISRHIYGQFAEHLGRGIYDGFWTKSGTGRWHLRDDVIAALRKIRSRTSAGRAVATPIAITGRTASARPSSAPRSSTPCGAT